MNTFYSKKGFYLILLVSLFWGLISAYWYVCGINGFCENDQPATAEVVTENIEEIEELFEDSSSNEVVPTVTKKVVKKTFSCTPYMVGTIRLGSKNSINEVAKLEKFLNEFEGENLGIDGTYSSTDRDAVIRMQNKYSKQDVALGYGTETSDGVVGPKTRLKINELYCIAKSKEKIAEDN